MGVSLPRGRKPSLVSSVLDPRWPRGGGGGPFWPAVVQKDGGEGGEDGRGGEGRGGCRFVCSCKLGLYGFE